MQQPKLTATRIAIVDDRITNRRIWAQLAYTLGDGVIVNTFSDPLEALESFRKRVPDLIITDFKMPVMDGAAFIRELRQMPDCADIPVIVVTVYKDRSYRYEALTVGATDFLMSPVDHFEFRARARNLLTLRRQQQLLKTRADDLKKALQTQTKAHRKALSDSRERLLGVIDTVPAIIYATDEAGLCIFINSFGAQFTDHQVSDLFGKDLAHLFGEEKAARDAEKTQDLLAEPAGAIVVYEETLKTGNGEGLTLLTRKTRLRDPEVGDIVLTVATDITERKAMETALLRAKEHSDAANRAKTEFLANMSHELRTPLNAILGFSEIMALQTLGAMTVPRYLEYANDIHSSANHLMCIINDILDLARVEEGNLKLEFTTVDIEQLVLDALRMVEAEAAESSVRLQVEISPGLPAMRGDVLRLRQALLNFMVNAIKFTPTGGDVRVQATQSRTGKVSIRVTDTGIGMTKDEIEVARTRFGQVFKAPEAKQFGGVGLGLPLSIAFVEMHGGEVEIISTPQKGTSVVAIFPPECLLDGGTDKRDAISG